MFECLAGLLIEVRDPWYLLIIIEFLSLDEARKLWNAIDEDLDGCCT